MLPVMIAEHLHFDVPRLKQIFFQVHASVAESVLRLRRSVTPRRGEVFLLSTRRMPLPPPPATAFSTTGYPSYAQLRRGFGISDRIERAGHRGHADSLSEVSRGRLRTKLSMATAEGPMKVIPAASQARASAGFSARNP